MLFNFMSTYFLSRCIHKVHPVRLTCGLFEGEENIFCLYVVGQGFSKDGKIFWEGLRSLLMVEL